MRLKSKVAKGRFVLTGDVVFLYENLERNVPVGLNYSLPECYQAMDLLRSLDAELLPGHDPRILELYPGGKIVDQ